MDLTLGSVILPGDPNHEVKSSWTASEDVQLAGLTPHMHLRGKDFKFIITSPDGHQIVLLDVPRYDFNWQLQYDLKDYLNVSKGARIDCVAHFANSMDNPSTRIRLRKLNWAKQTWEEMMIGWIIFVVPSQAENSKAVQ